MYSWQGELLPQPFLFPPVSKQAGLGKDKGLGMCNERSPNEVSAKGTIEEQQNLLLPRGSAGEVHLPACLSLPCVQPSVHVLELVTLRPSQI